MARHTPENGFIVDKVQGWVIAPSGQKSPIAFRYFVQDSERNLQAALFSGSDSEAKTQKGSRSERICSSSQAFPARWIVGVPSEPLQLTDGSRIQIDLKQVKSIDSKPALIQRCKARGK